MQSIQLGIMGWGMGDGGWGMRGMAQTVIPPKIKNLFQY